MILTDNAASSLLEELEIEIEERDMQELHVWTNHDKTYVIVGYLIPDTDCSNPFEGDGNGEIITRNFNEHIGRDSDGEPDYSQFEDYLTRVNIHEEERRERVAVLLWEEACAAGKLGTPYAVCLTSYNDEYEISEDDRTDAVWIPDKEMTNYLAGLKPNKRQQCVDSTVASMLEEYNKWVSGDCWGYVITEFKKSGGTYVEQPNRNSCFGFVGGDYAFEELSSEFKHSIPKEEKQLKLSL